MKRFWSSGLLSLVASCCLLLCLWPSVASANNPLWNFYDYPFFDGGFPEGAADVQGFQVAPIYDVGKSLSGSNGKKVPGIHETDTMAMLFQWVYFYPEAIQPWSWLLPSDNKHITLSSDFFFDYATTHADVGQPTGVGVGGGGVGDVEWTPMGIGIAYQHWQYEDWFKLTGYISPLIEFPLGDYDAAAARGGGFPGLGSNAWTVLPAFIGWNYLGKNFGPLEGSEWQTDLIYFHQFTANDQALIAPNTLGSFTPGDSIVWNNAFLVPLLKSLKGGIGVTWYQTLGAPTVNGKTVPGPTEQQELGIGPAFSSHFGPVNFWVSMASDIMTKNVYRQLGFYVTADYAFPTSDLYKDQLLDWMK
jgi:hypothetical protein